MQTRRVAVRTAFGLLCILVSLLLAYDLASPAFDLTAYAPDPLSSATSEFAAGAIVYLLGATLLVRASRSMTLEGRDASAAWAALLAIAAIPVCALLAFGHYWTEIGFVILAVVLTITPLAIGFARSA
jgi:hypothetical protein